MNVVGFNCAELGASLPGERTNPHDPGLQNAQEYIGDLGWTMHRIYLKGRSRIESAIAATDTKVTKTSIMRLSSAAART